MRSQKSQLTLKSPSLWNQSHDLFQNCREKPLCPGKYEATHLCLNPKCETLAENKQKIPTRQNHKIYKKTHNFFICSNVKCKVCLGPHCRQWKQTKKQVIKGRHHQSCFIADYNIILSCIEKKRKDCQPLEDSINKIFDDFIDYLSDLRQKCLEELKYNGLSSSQQKFLACFNKRQFEQITPELSLQIVKSLPNQVKDDVLITKKMLEQHWKKQEVKAKEIFESIRKKNSIEKANLLDKVTMMDLDVEFQIIEQSNQEEEGQFEACVRGLSFNASDSDVRKLLEPCGLILNVTLLMGTDGKSKGIAFVKFNKRSALKKALELSGTEHLGKFLKIEEPGGKTIQKRDGREFNQKIPREIETKVDIQRLTLFIDGLSQNSTSNSIKQFFSQAGKVRQARVVTDKLTKKPIGFGYVEFFDIETAKKAYATLNGSNLDGKQIRLDSAVQRDKPARGLGEEKSGFGEGIRGGFRGGFVGESRGEFNVDRKNPRNSGCESQ